MLELLFYLTFIGIIFPFTLYPLSLFIISKFYSKKVASNLDYIPTISFIISAYNEEKSIQRKIENVCELDYENSKVEIIVASDGSSDTTDQIVESLISKNRKGLELILLKVTGRKGKTNAQNEAVKIAKNEVLVFSDANSIWEKQALKHLVGSLSDKKVGYACGKLQYVNTDVTQTSSSESKYWNFDLTIRKMESNIYSIVGGNGAIYAIRKEEYVELSPILSHDGFIPSKFILKGLKSKYNEKAVAFEKAGENTSDEFGRKVRMQRGQPWKKYTDIQKFNFFKTGWFAYFYFGHKYLKYLLYIFHPLLLILNIILAFNSSFYLLILIPHCTFYILALIESIFQTNRKLFYFPYYYLITVVAQGVSVYNTLSGKTKANWEKAESTR